MAVLTSNVIQPPGSIGGTNCKSSLKGDAGTSPPNPPQQLIFVRYLDHVLYNRNFAVVMKPQKREAVGWLVYDCELYLILSWDRDAEPPTLHGGDPKASGLVLLKSDILDLQRLKVHPKPLPKNLGLNLKSKQDKEESEFALQPKKRKTQREAMAT
ncbi:MAG: hypothetical protein NWF04_01735 [Candidatus Bathyarchaeota archaeon]|nr:hypothetical protein [Candidatus Bathyarchaeota archaeon]